MKSPKVFAALCLLLLTSAAEAAFTNAKCDYVLTSSGEVQINRQWDVERRLCFLSISPRSITDLKYRDYYISSRGEFMVFNSYGEGSVSSTTSSRDYFLFPLVTDYPDYSIESNGDVIIKMVTGHELRLSAIDFSIVSFTPGSFTELPLSPKNKGGVEIRLGKGYWVDAGFKMGGVNFDSPNAVSAVKSAQSSTSCNVTNKEFLNYASDGNYSFKFQAEDLTQFFAKKCSSLVF